MSGYIKPKPHFDSMPILTPAYDNKIARKYSARTIEHKILNKTSLQEELGWIAEPKQPIVCFPAGVTDALGGALMERTFEGILQLPIGIVIRGRGSAKYGKFFTDLVQTAGHRVAILPDEEASLRKMLAGSDIAMFFSDHDEDQELKNALRYGVIPVSPPRETLDNYNPVQESGNAFIYEVANPWQCYGSLVRALETFKFPYDWRTIQRHAMESMDRVGATVEAA